MLESAGPSTGERLYFDAQTGLLLRTLQIRESPLGPVPFQIDFEDYREVDGVKVPALTRRCRPDFSFAARLDQIQHNVPIDDAKFDKPAPSH